ncbi:MAG: SMC-Scp complex subunit ScpB [Candidatus Niyogibacteria bacterium]|nr:SMC-Scp complex subunit ScpB [Candidatus Niyogibacteria bacterium]
MMKEALSLSKRIEAVLFVHGEPMSIARLSELLGAGKTEIRDALLELDSRLTGSALRLVYALDDVQLACREYLESDVSALVSAEFARGLSRAGAETLAVVAYRGPVSKKDIDYIRGVNSAFALRSLLIRGLIARRTSDADRRTTVYEPTLDFLKFMGVGRREDLTGYAEFQKKTLEFTRSQNATQEI